MKKKIELLSILMISILSISCQAQKTRIVREAIQSQVLYQQVVKALENQSFVIEAKELYLSGEKNQVISTSGNYISMDGHQAVINLTPDVFLGDPWTYLIIKDNTATIAMTSKKKNADLEYKMKIDGGQPWLKREVLITLYKNTNKCYIQIKDRAGKSVVNFKGYIYSKKG